MPDDPALIGLATLVAAYAAFFFVAERANPFGAPSAPLRRARWRHARRIGLAVLVTGALAIALPPSTGLEREAALAVAALPGLALAALSWRTYRRRASPWEHDRERSR